MKTATATAAILAAANTTAVAAKADSKSKSGKQSTSCIPDPKDLRYGAPCVEKTNTDIKCGDKGGSKSTKKGKGKKLYYDGEEIVDGEENCVEAKQLDVTKCEDHTVVVYEDKESCEIAENDTNVSTEACKWPYLPRLQPGWQDSWLCGLSK